MAAPTFLGSGIREITSTGTTANFTLNIPSGTTLIVFAVDHWQNPVTVSGVTINSVSATQLGTQIAPNGAREGGWAGTLASPTTGASVSATVTFSGSQTSTKLLHYFCFSGSPAIDVIQDWTTGSGSPVNFSLITTQANDFIGAFVFDFATVAHGSISGFTENQQDGTSGGTFDYSESWYLADAGAAATENFSWTQGGSPVTTRFAFAVRGAVESGQTVAVGLSSEADTAQAIDRRKEADVGLSSETDTGQPVTAQRIVAVGLATETDSGQSITAQRIVAAGLASETDTAHAVTAGAQVVDVGLVTETDSAFAVSVTKTTAVGLASETDTGQAVTGARIVAVGLATETDSSQAVSVRRVLEAGMAAETDTALAMLFSQTVEVGLAVETDTAFLTTAAGGARPRRDTGGGAGHRAMRETLAMIRRRRQEEEEILIALIEEEDAA